MVFQAIFVGRPRVSPQELEILEAKLTCGGVNYTMTGYLSDSHLLRLYRQSSVALLFSEYEGHDPFSFDFVLRRSVVFE